MIMATDIRLNDDAVVIDGSLGLGTDAPKRPIHSQNGEIHSGGAAGGLSFGDRSTPVFHNVPANGQRWVWFAQGGVARLWSGSDSLTVRKTADGFDTTMAGKVSVKEVAASGSVTVGNAVTAGQVTAGFADFTHVDTKQAEVERLEVEQATLNKVSGGSAKFGLLSDARLVNVVGERIRGAGPATQSLVDVRSGAVALNDPRAPEFVEGPILEIVDPGVIVDSGVVDEPGVIDDPQTPGPLPPHLNPIPPRLALFHEFGDNTDRLVLNKHRRYAQGVRVEGPLDVQGPITELSSITTKAEVRELSAADAMSALEQLTPVTYRHRDEGSTSRHAGFVAEDVPELVAQPGRDRLRAMDIVAVLTAALQEQQRTVQSLAAEVAVLRTRVASS
jgi:hypothetical protein